MVVAAGGGAMVRSDVGARTAPCGVSLMRGGELRVPRVVAARARARGNDDGERVAYDRDPLARARAGGASSSFRSPR